MVAALILTHMLFAGRGMYDILQLQLKQVTIAPCRLLKTGPWSDAGHLFEQLHTSAI